MTPVFLSSTVYLHFGTSSASTGAATNADSTPTVTIAEDGVDMGYAPTVTNIATGLYMVTIAATAANGFEAGKRYSVYVAATVGGIAGRDGLDEFEVLAVDLNTGVASVSGLTASNLDVAVSSRLASASYTAPDNSSIATILTRTDVATSTRMASFTLPTNFSLLAISGAGAVTVGTNNDKTGYSLTQSFPANFSSFAITAAGVASADIKAVNGLTVQGSGTAGDPWGP